MNETLVDTVEAPVRRPEVRKVLLGRAGGVGPDRRELTAMGSLLALLYGVDLLLRASAVTPWFECALSGAILITGRRALQRGLERFFYRLRPDGETLLALGALVAFFYSFVLCVLYSVDRLAPGHLQVTASGREVPILYFTTAGTIVLGASLGHLLLGRAESLLELRRKSQWKQVLRSLVPPAADKELPGRRWENHSVLGYLSERLGMYWFLVIFLLVVLATTGGLVERSGLRAATVGSVITILVCSAPTIFRKATSTLQVIGSIWAAQRGFVFQSARAIESLACVDAACFNKLGTLTVGCPQVTDVVPIQPGLHPDEIIYLASVLEAQTEHPFREAILLRISDSARTIPRVRGFRCVPGRGLRAVFHGQEIVFGSVGYLEELGVDCDSVQERVRSLAGESKTVLVLAKAGEVLGIVALADERREEAREAIDRLRELQVRTAVTSGDAPDTVEAVTGELGFDEIHGGLSREECVALLREMKGRGYRVAMVGGGVSNASVLAQADLGIAFGLGQEGLVQSAEVVLRGKALHEIPQALELARRTRRWILGVVAGLIGFQSAILGVVVALWLGHSLAGASGDAVRGSSLHVLVAPFLAGGLGFASALLPAGVVWAVLSSLRRLDLYDLENAAESRLY